MYNRTLKGSTTLGQSGPGNNGNEKVLHTSQISRPEPCYQMQFSVIPKTPPFSGSWVIPHCKGYSQNIQIPTNSAEKSIQIKR